MLILQPDTVHIWTLDFTVPRDSELLNRYMALLSQAEKSRMARFARDELQQKYLLTRAMMRSCLSHYADVAPQDWQFAAENHGKPYLTNAPFPLSFNLSHSGERAVLAVARGISVGIDVEQISRSRDLVGIAQHFFHPSEAEQITSLSAAEQQNLFFRLWTLKEAYFKARGTGISTGLEKVCFSLTGESITARFAPELLDDASAWQFLNYQFDGDYYLALAARPSPAAKLEVIFYESRPLSTQAPRLLMNEAFNG